MQFFEPSRFGLLWLIPLLALLALWGNRLWKRRLAQIGRPDFIADRLMPGFSLARQRAAWVLLVTVFFLSTVALARPQWGEEKRRIERKGLDVIFLFDTSLSMLAQDAKPDRLRKAKLEIKGLIRRFTGHRIGMIAFAGSSFLQCPLTLDYSAFLLFVDALKPGYIPNPGTSLSRALELAVRAFPSQNQKYKAVILLSDGEDHEGGVEQALELVKKAGVRVYTIGVGSEEGEPIPLRGSPTDKVAGYKKDRNGQVVVTRLNRELLEKIARETSGIYLPATAAEKEIDVVIKHLESLGERKLRERLVSEKEDHYQLFLFIAFLLLAAESLLGNRRRGGRGLASAALPLLALFLFTGFLDTPRSLVEKGNRNAKEKRYETAVENYRKAQVSRPNEPVIRYNLGTSLYELYKYRDSEKELEQALREAKDSALKAKAIYNYGNTQYRLGNFEKAIEAYKKALDINPKDEDAKYNLEFLQKKKSLFEKKQEEKQRQQPQQQRPQPQQEQNQQDQPQPQNKEQEDRSQADQQKDQQQQDQESQQASQQQEKQGQGQKPEEQREEGQKQQQGQQEEQEEKEQRQKEEEKRGEEEKREAEGREEEEREQQEEKGGKQEDQQQDQSKELGDKEGRQPLQGQMSLENARRILDALMQSEKELQDLRKPPVEPGSPEPLKDW